MLGDFADFEGLVRLRRKYGFLLAVDEAHATLVCGSRCTSRARHPHKSLPAIRH
jgi:7-keto-8-aminopelargonate synthetase-like enzyme